MRFFSSSLKNLWVLAALLPLATGLACGKQAGHVRVMPVHGRVFWRGKPLANALVILHPQNTAELAGLRPLAHADQTGSFELTTYDEGDGAPAGDYAVTIEWRRP